MLETTRISKDSILDEKLKKLLVYWKQQLETVPPLELPTIHSQVQAISSRVLCLSLPLLSKSSKDEINQLSLKFETSVFMVLLAAFKALLRRYTNQEDILIGYYNTSVKPHDGNSFIQGDCNSRILLTKVPDSISFLELLSRVREVFIDAESQKHLSSELFAKGTTAKQEERQKQLFQVALAFSQNSCSQTVVNDLTKSWKMETCPISPADLTLFLEEDSTELTSTWEYNPDLFARDTIIRMNNHFKILLEGVIANPKLPICTLPMLSNQERNQQLFEWNNTKATYPATKCIHELFEEQVTRTPNIIAVSLYNTPQTISTQAQEALTYGELNNKANQLGHYLQKLGVGPEVLVGICVKRSIEMVIGILGILKAGGAYVPLDPSYPKERLAFMLQDSAAPLLLTQYSLVNNFSDTKAQIICLDADWNKIAACSDENIKSSVRPQNLAYVIYTSGSTGKPKGVLIIHRGVVNYLSWCINAYAVAGSGEGAPINSTIAFDATITSFFPPLLTGQQIFLLPEKNEIETLSAALSTKSHFSLVKITPAHLEILGHLLPWGRLKGKVKTIVIGGEALTGKYLQPWHTYFPGTRLINEYGPTETVVGCCTYKVSSENNLSQAIPIGRPIANMQIYILDNNLQPVPIGVAGQIYIGGEGVARGYLNREALTKEKFIPNPFSNESDAQLYKTGDLGRYLSDGNLVFLGRIDHQVKIRGYRIELGEIEAAVREHRSVKQVFVMAKDESSGDKHLICYVVPNSANILTADELRDYLNNKLPQYMVPSVFVFLEAFPLTANGKIDRASLPFVSHELPHFDNIYVAPRNIVEVKLVKIFEDCLQTHPVGVQDDLFKLGGSSIQAARAVSQIKKIFQKQLPLSVFVQAPTIEKLAVFLNEVNLVSWSCLVPIQPHGSKPPLFCIHGGLGHVLFYRSLANHLGADQPLYGLQAKGASGNEKPYTKVEDMAANYIREIQTVQPQGPYFLGGYCFGIFVAFEMAQQLTRDGHEVSLLANFNGISPTYVPPSDLIANENNEGLVIGSKIPDIINDLNLPKPLRLNTKEEIVYLFRSVKRRLFRYLNNTSFGVKMIIAKRKLTYDSYLALGRPIPEGLQKQHFIDTIRIAQNAYKPKVYQGKMIVFRSPKLFADPKMGWSEYVAGGIETCDIPGDHPTRRFILLEPFVQFLSKKLKLYLECELES